MTWSDREIQAGMDWAQEIEEHLDAAEIILLLVSSDFIASEITHSEQISKALERRKHEKVVIIPIILRPVHWEVTPIGKLQVLPKNKKAVTEWDNQDSAFREVAIGIWDVVASMSKGKFDEGNGKHPQDEQLEFFRADLLACLAVKRPDTTQRELVKLGLENLLQRLRNEQPDLLLKERLGVDLKDVLEYLQSAQIGSGLGRSMFNLKLGGLRSKFDPRSIDDLIKLGDLYDNYRLELPEYFREAICINLDLLDEGYYWIKGIGWYKDHSGNHYNYIRGEYYYSTFLNKIKRERYFMEDGSFRYEHRHRAGPGRREAPGQGEGKEKG
jgi:hypothetical protein